MVIVIASQSIFKKMTAKPAWQIIIQQQSSACMGIREMCHTVTLWVLCIASMYHTATLWVLCVGVPCHSPSGHDLASFCDDDALHNIGMAKVGTLEWMVMPSQDLNAQQHCTASVFRTDWRGTASSEGRVKKIRLLASLCYNCNSLTVA